MAFSLDLATLCGRGPLIRLRRSFALTRLPCRVEVSHGRVFRRADQSIKTLTLASEILQAALVLGPSPEDPSEFGPTSKGR